KCSTHGNESLQSPASDHPPRGSKHGAAVTHVVLEDLVQPAGEEKGIDQIRPGGPRLIFEDQAQPVAKLAEVGEEVVGRKWRHSSDNRPPPMPPSMGLS